jgi:hypothetical protein
MGLGSEREGDGVEKSDRSGKCGETGGEEEGYRGSKMLRWEGGWESRGLGDRAQADGLQFRVESPTVHGSHKR